MRQNKRLGDKIRKRKLDIVSRKLRREIIKRKHAEAALSKIEERYSLAVQAGKTAVWKIWPGKKKLFADANLKSLLGYEENEITDNIEDWLQLLPPDDLDKTGEALQKICARPADHFSIEHRAVHKDGTMAWFRSSGKVLRDINTQAIHIIGASTDISDQKRADEAVMESERCYRYFVENSNIGITKIDRDYNIIMVNPSVVRMFDKPASEFVGKKCFQEFRKQDAVCKHCPGTRAMTSGRPEEAETKGVKYDGTHFYLRNRAVPIFSKNGKAEGFAEFMEDITEFKRNENSLRESEAEFRLLVKELAASLREKEVILREIHHRVKNNLQIVISLLRSQSRQLKDRKMLEVFQESQNRIKAMSLIHETLFLSSDLSYVDFSSYIKKLAETLFEAFGINRYQIFLVINAEDISLVMEDAIPMGLVINELLTNALKYAFPDDRPGKIRIDMAAINEDQIELSVSDNGVGLPPDMDFKNIETLGLTLISGLVEIQLDGTLELIRDRGTKCTIRFIQEKRKE